jgi:hypothetical protein
MSGVGEDEEYVSTQCKRLRSRHGEMHFLTEHAGLHFRDVDAMP